MATKLPTTATATPSNMANAAAILALTADNDVYPFRQCLNDLMTVIAAVLSFKNDKECEQQFKSFRVRVNAAKDNDVFRMLFNGVFKRHRGDILKGYEKNEWLAAGNVEIVFPSTKKAILRLSHIYRLAVGLNAEAEKSELTEEQRMSDQRLILFDAMMLHLYQLFTDVAADGGDREQLHGLTRIVAADLGVDENGNDAEPELDMSNLPEFNLEDLKRDPRGIDKLLDHPLMNSLLNGAQNLVKPILPKQLQQQINNGMLRKQFRELMTNPEMLNTLERVNKNMATATTPQENVRIAQEALYEDGFLRTMILQQTPAATEEEIQESIRLMKNSQNFVSNGGFMQNMAASMGAKEGSSSSDNTKQDDQDEQPDEQPDEQQDQDDNDAQQQ